ncbi:hypothetical protein CYMTET_8614 [Cymbomonas tetramitiformis]|uniref:Uncharacterized protein n=1 Tax=Cymbomonas tetramitiformis TaxID=36881 RepID=A0AAE0GSN2_9CHLO|nr:hypothetical protein CYMTET_8614 [Cymbomonas tetramitiformis]
MVSNITLSNITKVPLRYCVIGEQLIGDLPWQHCEVCQAGWLSLDNSSACLDCQAVLDCHGSKACPIECPGGSEYVVCQGAYLAPQAQYCDNPKNLSTQCLVDRLYLCETDAACSTNGGADTCSVGDVGNVGRVGRGTDSVSGLELCNEEEFVGSSIVLCGGQAPIICSDGHYRELTGGECLKCSSRAQVLAMSCAAIGGMALAAGLIAYLLLFVFPNQASMAKKALKKSLVNGKAQATVVQLRKARTACGLVVGYLQVMGQLSHIYAAEVIPREIQVYLSWLGFANFDFEAMLNLRCIRYHFVELQFSGEFMRNFYQSVSLPWLLCASLTMLYFFILHKRNHTTRVSQKKRTSCGITLQPQEEWDQQMTEVEWRHNVRSTCMAAALFLMMLFHPTISTITFQLFKCDPVYFDDDSRAIQYWLHLDTTVECFTPEWFVAMGFAVFTMTTYVVGFPLGLFLTMHHLRQYQRLCIPRHVAERHIALIRDGVWIPCRTEDAVTMQLHGSWFGDGGESWHDAGSKLAAISLHGAGAAATSSESLRCDSVLDAAEAEKGSTDEEPGADEVEIFVLRRSFVLLGPLKKQRRSSIRERMRAMPAAGLPQAGSSCREKARIQLTNGQVIEEVFCLQKPEIQVGEDDESCVMHYTPMTRLDSGHPERVLGHVHDPFEDEFYYYQCYEMCRRVLQTGVVVLFSMVAGDNAALLYALIFSGIALLIHQRFSPYKHDALDNLQLFILMNQFMAQASLLLHPLDLQSSAFGITLVVAQVLLVVYTGTLIYPAFKPVIDHLLDKIFSLMSMKKKTRDFASSAATFLNPAYSEPAQSNPNGIIAC